MRLTYAKAKELLTEIVAEYGEDYAYTRIDDEGPCYYVHRDESGEFVPGCIVGVLLHKMGFDLEWLMRCTLGPVVSYLYTIRLQRPDFSYEVKAESLLIEVQVRQDRGVPWGQAVREALEMVSE